MKLYGHATSPYVRKVRIALHERNLRFEWVQEAPVQLGARIVELNPLAKVPVIETDDGQVFFDSALIIEYLDSLGVERLIPPEGADRFRALSWNTLGAGVVDATVARLLEGRRPEGEKSKRFIVRQEETVARALAWAEKAIPNAPYLVGTRFGIADLGTGLALEYIDFRYPHDWRSTRPRLAKWLAGISTRGSFAETAPPGMEKVPDGPH